MSFHPTQTRVFVEDLKIEAYVGHLAPERDQLQTVSIDISCIIQNPEVPDDELLNTFDYIPLVEEIRGIALSRKRRLIETFAEEIAELCFVHAHVQNVVVSIRKPNKLPGVAAVGTQRTFERG